MNVLLVNPFIYDFAAFDFWAKPRGLLEVGRMLTERGCSVTLMDCLCPQDSGMAAYAANHPHITSPKPRKHGTGSYFHEEIPRPLDLEDFPRHFHRFGFPPDHLRERLRGLEREPDWVGVTGIMTYWHAGVRDTIEIIKETLPAVPVVLGGIYPTLLPEHARAHSGADAVLAGRATAATLREVLEGFGLELPELALSESVFYPYAAPAYGITATSEGCWSRCSYCACWKLFPGWQGLSASQSRCEVEHAVGHGCQDIAFYDDDLLFDFERRLQPLLAEIHAHFPGLRFHTPNGLYLKHISPSRASQLKRLGFETLRFGFETADATLSQRIGHKISRDDFRQRIEWLLQAGFDAKQMGVYLMIGLPGQAPEQVAESIAFVESCGAYASLTEFSPVPGTPEFEAARKESLVDFTRDPLLQNNSLLPLRSRQFSLPVVNQLKNLCYEQR